MEKIDLVEVLNPATGKREKIDPSITFIFLGVKDCGFACCPHCGADGRYIYYWIEKGNVCAAMAGCYEQLTGKIAKGDKAKVMELIAKKQSRNKALNGWERSILRMEEFKAAGKYPAEWCDMKIHETLSQRKAYLARR